MLFSFGTNAGRTCAFRDKGFPLWLIGYSSGQQRVTTSFARHYDNSTSHGWMEVWSRSLIVIGIDCAVCVDRRFTFASSGLKWSCLIDESGCSWELLVVTGDFTSKCVLEINKGTDHASVLTMWRAISTSGVRRLVLLGSSARVETNLWTFHHITQTRTLTATCTRVFYFYCPHVLKHRFQNTIGMMCWSQSVVFRRFCKFFSFPETIVQHFSDEVHSTRARRLEA